MTQDFTRLHLPFYSLESDVLELERDAGPLTTPDQIVGLATLSWHLRQRDGRRALVLAEQVTSRLKKIDAAWTTAVRARMQLIRAETGALYCTQENTYALVESAADKFRQTQDTIGEGDAHLVERLVAHAHGDMERAIDACKRAQQHYAATDSLRLALAQAWETFLSVFRDVAPAEAAVERLRKAQIAHPSLEALLLATEGVISSRRGDLSRAARAHFQASERAKSAGMVRLALISAINSAGMLQELGDYDGAAELIDETLILAKASQWPVVIGLCMMRLGELLQILGQSERSHEVLTEALPYFKSLPTGANKATVYAAIGDSLLARGNADEALATMTTAADLFRADGHLQGLAAALIGKARALSACHRPEEAIECIRPLQDGREREYAIQTARALADIHARHNLSPPAHMATPNARLHYLEEALRTGSETEGWNVPTTLLVELSDAWKAAGDLERSYDYLRRAFSTQKEEGARRAAARALSLEMRHEAALSRRDAERERDQALEASRLKSEFVANMSHEIRTPMNGIIGMSDVLAQTALSNDQKECVTTIRDSAYALLGIINDILDFSKIEAGRLELEAVQFDCVRVIESVADLLAPQAHTKRLSLMTHVDPSIPRHLVGDAGRLRQILINLAGNAIKFTETGSVWILGTAKRRKGSKVCLNVEVRDTGIGMPPQAVDKLFQPFTQADGSTTRRFGGTGLGLSISKRLVELMHGTITARSREGKGSSFAFSIWFDVADQPPSAIDTMRLPTGRVLVVDDEELAREILSRHLSSWGLETRTFATATEALQALRADGDRFELALIDLRMPEIDGLKLAKDIRSDRRFKELPMVMITAFDDGTVGTSAIEAGFSAFLTKPIRQSQLFDCIAGLLYPVTREREIRKSSSTAGTSLRSGRILVAEDNAVNQKVALRQLQKLCADEIVIVPNGEQAVATLNRGDFALVFLDCQMPIMDGFTAAREIRKAEVATGAHVPIIAMTANALEGDREACIRSGMDDYIAKPVQLDELRRVVARWLPER